MSLHHSEFTEPPKDTSWPYSLRAMGLLFLAGLVAIVGVIVVLRLTVFKSAGGPPSAQDVTTMEIDVFHHLHQNFRNMRCYTTNKPEVYACVYQSYDSMTQRYERQGEEVWHSHQLYHGQRVWKEVFIPVKVNWNSNR